MKTKALIAFILCAIFTFSCEKQLNSDLPTDIKPSFGDSAINFLKANLTIDEVEQLDLSTGLPYVYHNQAIGFSIYKKGSARDTFIVLYKQSGNFFANRVTISNLRAQTPGQYSGSITLQSLDRRSGKILDIQDNKVTNLKVLNPDNNSISRESNLAHRIQKVLPEIVIIAYRGVGSDGGFDGLGEYFSLYWIFNENYDVAGLYTPSVGSGSSAGGGGSITSSPQQLRSPDDNVTTAPNFTSPAKPLSDVRNELKCFTNNTTSVYTISVNVNQPEPNTRKVFNPLSDFPVGHTFLTLKQQNADGSIIARNVGFYPKNNVKPGATTDESIFGDDSNTPYDVSLQIEVSASDYFKVLYSLVVQQSKVYELNNFNCTNSSIDALSSININLPSTKSSDLLFEGSSPADLGEDIRHLDLNSFSNDNGNRKMSRTLSSKNDRKAPGRKGGC